MWPTLFIHLYVVCALSFAQSLNCPGCDQILCSPSFCSRGEFCYLKNVTCTSEPCMKVPSCISATDICNNPFFDDSNAVWDCASVSSCPIGFSCENGYCCDVGSMDLPASENFGDEDIIPDVGDGTSFFPEFEDNERKQDSPETSCDPCSFSPCSFATCVSNEQVTCMMDNCSCLVWYENEKGMHVECEPPGETDISNIPIDLFPTEEPTASSNKHLTVATNDISNIPFDIFRSDAKLTSLKPSAAVTSTRHDIVTLQSVDPVEQSDNRLILVIGGLGLAALLAAIGFAAYKVYSSKISRQNDASQAEIIEVKVPLTDVSQHNNNDVKQSDTLNGHSNANPV